MHSARKPAIPFYGFFLLLACTQRSDPQKIATNSALPSASPTAVQTSQTNANPPDSIEDCGELNEACCTSGQACSEGSCSSSGLCAAPSAADDEEDSEDENDWVYCQHDCEDYGDDDDQDDDGEDWDDPNPGSCNDEGESCCQQGSDSEEITFHCEDGLACDETDRRCVD